VIIVLQIYQAHKTAGCSRTGNATSFANLVCSRSTVIHSRVASKRNEALEKEFTGHSGISAIFYKV
jgi:hypothetical protein